MEEEEDGYLGVGALGWSCQIGLVTINTIQSSCYLQSPCFHFPVQQLRSCRLCSYLHVRGEVASCNSYQLSCPATPLPSHPFNMKPYVPWELT